MGDVDHHLVQVVWEGPLPLDQALTRDTDEDLGLYQVYGDHLVFGPVALLYVGMTADQKFAARFKQHKARWLQFDTGVEIRLGRLRDKNDMRVIGDVEALTIWWHSPPYNCKHIWGYDGAPLRIQNWGARGRLHAEYSSHWTPRMAATAPDQT